MAYTSKYADDALRSHGGTHTPETQPRRLVKGKIAVAEAKRKQKEERARITVKAVLRAKVKGAVGGQIPRKSARKAGGRSATKEREFE